MKDTNQSARLLTEDDFIKGSFGAYRSEEGGCCLWGHCKRLSHFAGVNSDLSKQIVSQVIDKELGEGKSLVNFNDSPLIPKSVLARVWNRTLYLLGYTEGNPEKRKLNKRILKEKK
jgi:hypothetical protein